MGEGADGAQECSWLSTVRTRGSPGMEVFSDASRSGQEAAPSTGTYPAPRPQQTLTWPPVRLSVSPAPKDTPQALATWC